ncbi:hypothetical protein Clacol_003744 [Clathrus columnatus]|uniref:Chromatin-remodeling ATPase INO80 n=1 Tax=Clathrus columnatus TaxID=1419009 RepID=A0AAV5A922_9AGAM|nr:hypothetical protein Clacol_003744 [Clathrus columnatus]
MSLSRILNVDTPPPRHSSINSQPHPQSSHHYKDNYGFNDNRALKRRRSTTGDDQSLIQQHDHRWPSPSSDLDDCPEIWRDELNKYMVATRLRARQVEHWFEEKNREKNAAIAQHTAHDYSSRLSNANEIDRARSASIERDILDTLNDTPPSPPVTNNPLYPDETKRMNSASHSAPKGKSRQPIDSDVESLLPLNTDSIQTNTRKRKRKDADDLSDSVSNTAPPPKKRGGRRKAQTADDPPKPSRIRRGPRKNKGTTTPGTISKLPSEEPSLQFQPPSRISPPPSANALSLDITPMPSAPSSPVIMSSVLPGIAPGFWPLNEPVLPLKRPKKLDQAHAAKRVMAIEEAQRRIWLNIARRDIIKVYRYHSTGFGVKAGHHKRLASMAASQARKSSTRTTKSTKETQIRAKRLMREMLVFWKRNEREERDVRKRAEKEAVDRAKEEEERREAARQARKLEFLISQTELYSHFVGNKLKTAEAEQLPDEGKTSAFSIADLPPGAEEKDSIAPLDALDFDDEDQTNLHKHAARNAHDAIRLARERAQAFDVETGQDRKNTTLFRDNKFSDNDEASTGEPSNLTPNPKPTSIVDLDSDELNFQNPTSLKELTIAQPRMLMAQLKEYQLKGLNWLATLYEQGINGILADEMGLGKTVQSISLLAYLAETHDIWGPFLVIAPASTLHNWQQEITRFVPALKPLPYWGNVKDRTTLRKFWNKKQISYNQDAPFHVLITSYPLIVQDDKYFQRVKWQYMILDEAQAIKSSSSARWKTLLNFQCRNRLLLTGTPVQNSMQELWALLHFIMPSLFDSHDEFSEWFSKDIENAAENKGGRLNEHQLRRLHMILKPFMLRRVKRHVQNELSDKIEHDIYCDLSPRQRALYRGLRANISVTELLQKAANLGDADSAISLMNLVMQFRKVCNHPELFERSDVVAPFSFCQFGRSGSLLRESDYLECPYSTRNPIELTLPSLFVLESGLLDIPGKHSNSGFRKHLTTNLLNIWTTSHILRSLQCSESSFSFLYLSRQSPRAACNIFHQPPIITALHALETERLWRETGNIVSTSDFIGSYIAPVGLVPPRVSRYLERAEGLPLLAEITWDAISASYISRQDIRWRSDSVVAPPIMLECTSKLFTNQTSSPLSTLAFYGTPDSLAFSQTSIRQFRAIIPFISPYGLFRSSPQYQIPWSPMQVPEGKRLIYDSSKLARLDLLLQELKAGDHRVLIYFQMTKMMDLMEEYLVYRQYKYLRLDGSSKLEDRRDMVLDWQTRPEIFIFLLSTRAGGLGINLTAADTVIFYDHDWNPSNDAQAMDRAHRLGQTRQVTVYRLITRGTIDERIVQLARVKKDVQDIVVGNKQFTEATKPSEIVSLLLNDEELANLENTGSVDVPTLSSKRLGKQPEGAAIRDLWNEEGDDFFAQPNTIQNVGLAADVEDDMTPPPSEIILPKRRGKGGGGKRGRRRKAAHVV